MRRKKHKIKIGVDEAGRGALAGPVIACAITIFPNSDIRSQIPRAVIKTKDSKKLTPQKREEIFNILKILRKQKQIEWGIGRVSQGVIDKINIFKATQLAMERAVNNLERKIQRKIELILIDGKIKINSPIPQHTFVKGDERIFLIKIASIVAKVTRDRLMIKYHSLYPQYSFNKHKGYGTKEHFTALKDNGPSPLHRKSFRLTNF